MPSNCHFWPRVDFFSASADRWLHARCLVIGRWNLRCGMLWRDSTPVMGAGAIIVRAPGWNSLLEEHFNISPPQQQEEGGGGGWGEGGEIVGKANAGMGNAFQPSRGQAVWHSVAATGTERATWHFPSEHGDDYWERRCDLVAVVRMEDEESKTKMRWEWEACKKWQNSGGGDGRKHNEKWRELSRVWGLLLACSLPYPQSQRASRRVF